MTKRRELDPHIHRQPKSRTYRKNQLERTYGLSWDAYEALWEGQDRRCAICRKKIVILPQRREGKADNAAAVDHCHETGKVRGLLCRLCNSGIGFLNDSPKRCRTAADYLERNSD